MTDVCIVGAGLSGLVSAKVLQHDGFDVTLFDKAPTLGGVWAPSRAYTDLCTNNPREHYAFSDLPHPETSAEFPTAGQVFEYLESYVEEFGLRPNLNLSTKVLSVSRQTGDDQDSHPGFEVTVQPANGAGDAESLEFDYVVLCNGVFSKPFLPEIEGLERFEGSVIHSSELLDRDMLAGQRVVVVGAGKSALDCASVAAHEADSCTLLFRQPHWMLPRYFPGGTRVDRVFFTRLSEKLLPAYYRTSGVETALRTVLAPALWAWRRAVSVLVSRVCGMPREMIPERPVTSGAENIGIGTRFYEILREDSAQARRAEIQSFPGGRTLQLDTDEPIDADLLIFATGWEQDVSILGPELRREVQRDGRFHLYRHIVPPEERRLAFNGYASAGNQALTSEIAAHWLSECFQEKLELPDVATMEDEIAERHDWAEEVFPKRSEGYFVGAYMSSYVDQLMQDMGLPALRADTVVSEYLAPLDVERYRGLAEERRSVLQAPP